MSYTEIIVFSYKTDLRFTQLVCVKNGSMITWAKITFLFRPFYASSNAINY